MSDLLPEGANGVVHGRGAIVSLQPVAAENVDFGSPRTGVLPLGPVGDSQAGLRELRDGAIVITATDEVVVVISGGATVMMLDESRIVDVKTGDVMRLTADTRTRWDVKDHIRLVYLTAA